jgi:FeS assembly SUF system protein
MTPSAADVVLQRLVLEVLSSIYDPEIPVNIYELGLVYDLNISSDGLVTVKMTLTAPGCPEAQSLPVEVEQRIAVLPGVRDVTVEVVWDPPWSPDRMSEAARLELGLL